MFIPCFRAPSCQSVVEIYDGEAKEGVKPSERLCSPLTKRARDPSGRWERNSHKMHMFRLKL